MKASLDNRVTVKLFTGFLINAELKREFFASDKWRLAEIAWQSQDDGLETIPYKGKEYIGKYVENQTLTTKQLRDIEDKIKQQLIHHCPTISDEDLKLCVFPQVFVS
jgi:hypothetical protein